MIIISESTRFKVKKCWKCGLKAQAYRLTFVTKIGLRFLCEKCYKENLSK